MTLDYSLVWFCKETWERTTHGDVPRNWRIRQKVLFTLHNFPSVTISFIFTKLSFSGSEKILTMNRQQTLFLIISEKYLEKHRDTGKQRVWFWHWYAKNRQFQTLSLILPMTWPLWFAKIILIPDWDLSFPLVQSIQKRYLKQNCTGNYSQDTPIGICTLAWE